jgi:hypothetical protein
MFHVTFDSSIGENDFVGFRHGITPAFTRTLYFDDFLLVETPSEPILSVGPGAKDFGKIEMGLQSAEAEFVISNQGIGTISLTPADISISGPNAERFLLTNIEGPVTLAAFESAIVKVKFAPQVAGMKTATLNIATLHVPLSGEGFNPLISVFPHFENFDAVVAPTLPIGWRRIVYNPAHTAAVVETNTGTTPLSVPNHARLFSNNSADQNVMLISPPITELETKRIRFWAKASAATTVPNLIVGTMTNPSDANTFVPFHTIQGITELTNVYQQFIIAFDATIGSNQYIAFRHGGSPTTTTRSIFIDDFLLEVMPTTPVAIVDPSGFEFAPTQIGVTSFTKEFVIINDGIGTLTVNPSDITISGADAASFVLNNISETINLGPFGSHTISAYFAPVEVGMKQAVLQVLDFQVPLTGEAIDATIHESPHLEQFTTVVVPALPFGWTKIVDNPAFATAAVETLTGNVPLSAPAHVRLFSNNAAEQNVLLVSPAVANLHEKRVRFFAKCNLTTNVPDLIVGTMSNPSDMSTFTVVATIAGADITNAYQDDPFTVNFSDQIGENKFIAFRHGGTPTLTRSIFLDDILIEFIPDEPVLAVTPDAFVFAAQQIAYSSFAQEFNIFNDGGGLLTLLPADISIQGTDASDFILENITEEVNLAPGQTISVKVWFAPTTVGDKAATLQVSHLQVPLSGVAHDATIVQVPHLENFTTVTVPALPFGWTRIVNNSNMPTATVETLTATTPNSAPAHVRLFSNDNPVQDVILISPPVSGLNSKMVSFVVKTNSTTNLPDLIVGTMTNPRDASTFVGIDTIIGTSMATSYGQPSVVYFTFAGDATFFAFRHGGSPQFTRSIFIDDILIESLPEDPIMEITPLSHVFDGMQIGAQPMVKDFVIKNIGGGTLTIAPANISITGADASDFILNNLTGEVNLISGQSAEFSVGFAPAAIGTKVAVLNVNDIAIPISGYAFDATITEFPWQENFTGIEANSLPLGWTRTHPNWGVSLTNNAGGASPEMRFNWSPSFSGTSYLYSPVINTTGLTELEFKFKNFLNNFMSPGIYSIKVVTIVGDTEYLVAEWVNPDDIAAHEFETLLTAASHGVGAEKFYIAWVFSGNSYDMNWWNIDDVYLGIPTQYYSVTFNVVDNNNNPITNAVVTFNGVANPAGNYVFDNVEQGTYQYMVERPGYVTVQDQVTVNDNVNVNVVLQLHTYTVTFVVTDDNLNPVTDAIITLSGVTNPAGNYSFSGILPGSYVYSVQKDGFITYQDMVSVDDQNVVIPVELSPVTFTVTFNVVDENQDALGSAIVTFNGVVNPAGNYVFSDITAGTYDYKVELDGYVTVEDQLVVADDIVLTVTMVELTYTVTFNILDDNQDPLTGAVVTFAGITNPAGDYIFTGITGGTYSYNVEKAGYVSAQGQVTVDDHKTVDVVLTEEVFTLTFTIEDEDGLAITDAIITLDGTEYDAGIYVFANLTAGEYQYSVKKAGYLEVLGQATLEGDLTIPVILVKDNVSVTYPSAMNLKIFPNPANSLVNIQAGEMIREIYVYDLLGQVVYSASVQQNNYQINVSGLNNGMYLIQVLTSKGITTGRLQIGR